MLVEEFQTRVPPRLRERTVAVRRVLMSRS